MVLAVKKPPANAGDIRDTGSIPGSGRSSGEGLSNPLHYSCLENPMDRVTWQATVYRVTRVRHDWSDLAHMYTMCYCQFLLNIRKIWISLSLYIESLSNIIPIMPMDHLSLYFGDNRTAAAAAAKSLQSCPTLFDPMDYSPPGSSVPGISQASILEWVVSFFSWRSSQPRDWTYGSCTSCIAGRWSLLNHQGRT